MSSLLLNTVVQLWENYRVAILFSGNVDQFYKIFRAEKEVRRIHDRMTCVNFKMKITDRMGLLTFFRPMQLLSYPFLQIPENGDLFGLFACRPRNCLCRA